MNMCERVHPPHMGMPVCRDQPFRISHRSLGLRKHRGEPACILTLENPSHWVDALWVVSLRAPRTEMASLQVLVNGHRNTSIQKQRGMPESSTHREAIAPKVSKIGKDFLFENFGWRGFGVEWFWDSEERAEKIRAVFVGIRDRNRAANQKSTASSRPSSFCPCSFRDYVLSSRTERPLENALDT